MLSLSKRFCSHLHQAFLIRLRHLRLLGHICIDRRAVILPNYLASPYCPRGKHTWSSIRMWNVWLFHRYSLNWRVKCQMRVHIHAVEDAPLLIKPLRNRDVPEIFIQHRIFVRIDTEIHYMHRKFCSGTSPDGTDQLSILSWRERCPLLHTHLACFSRFLAPSGVEVFTRNLIRAYFHQEWKRIRKT